MIVEPLRFDQYSAEHLWDAYQGGLRVNLADAVLWTYSVVQFPTRALPAECWIEMLRTCQATAADRRFRMRERSLTVYRGAHRDHAVGMSWSRSLYVARVFALSSRFTYGHEASVWSVEANPGIFLAQPVPNEVILNSELLEPHELMMPAAVAGSFGLPAR